jgi:hypothetical protein
MPTETAKVINFVPSQRPRDVMMAYVLNELNRLCVWQAEFDAVLRPHPREFTEAETALNYILNLLRLIEASPAIQAQLAAMSKVKNKETST